MRASKARWKTRSSSSSSSGSKPYFRALSRTMPFETRKPLGLSYRGEPLRQTYVADFVCYDRIIVELKAVRAIAPEHRAQTVNYLRVTDMKLGLLINFGSTPRVEIERFIL